MTRYDLLPRTAEGEVDVEKVQFPIHLPLLSPITVNGEAIDELVLREPNINDMEIAGRETSDILKMRCLIAQVAELSPDEAGLIGGRDTRRLNELLAHFL